MASPVGNSGEHSELPEKSKPTTQSGVHFQEETEEIPPTPSVEVRSVSPDARPDVSGEMDKLAEGLKGTSLQQHRLTHFDYQPFSLPPSRVSRSTRISLFPCGIPCNSILPMLPSAPYFVQFGLIGLDFITGTFAREPQYT